jgi:hypothetical protein
MPVRLNQVRGFSEIRGLISGVAAGVLNSARQTGSVLGVALFGSLIGQESAFLFGLRASLICRGKSHGRVEGRGPRSPQRREVEHRRPRPGRFARSWGRAPGRSRLRDRFLSLLGKATRAKGLRVWTIRRELHGGGIVGRRGLYWTPLSDRRRTLRSDCYRAGIRMDEPRMAALLVEHHRPRGHRCPLAKSLPGWTPNGVAARHR